MISLVPVLSNGHHLVRNHREVLTLEQSIEKYLAAETVRRSDFEQTLTERLEPL